MSNLPQTQRFSLAKSIMWKTQLFPKYASLRRSSQALLCHADIKQALKEAMKQASNQDIKQESE